MADISIEYNPCALLDAIDAGIVRQLEISKKPIVVIISMELWEFVFSDATKGFPFPIKRDSTGKLSWAGQLLVLCRDRQDERAEHWSQDHAVISVNYPNPFES